MSSLLCNAHSGDELFQGQIRRMRKTLVHCAIKPRHWFSLLLWDHCKRDIGINFYIRLTLVISLLCYFCARVYCVYNNEYSTWILPRQPRNDQSLQKSPSLLKIPHWSSGLSCYLHSSLVTFGSTLQLQYPRFCWLSTECNIQHEKQRTMSVSFCFFFQLKVILSVF